MYRRLPSRAPMPPWPARFGMRSAAQVVRDVARVARHLPRRDRYQFNVASASLLRPDLSLPAYAGYLPADGRAPIFNFFDRHGGGRGFRSAVTRTRVRDVRGGRLSYDEHDGTDFVCPPGTPVAAAAPGVVVAIRDVWLRGGLTLCVDHGDGVITQYTHLTSVTAQLGQPVERGEAIALSGSAGFEMTQFFPWVPPHLHFMVWVHGQPVDPYRQDGEATAGAWAHGREPLTSGPLGEDRSPDAIASDVARGADGLALEALLLRCQDAAIRLEMGRAASLAERAALVEDSLHHDRWAWPEGAFGTPLRRPGDPARVRLTLPLSAALYRSAVAADTPWTRPR